MTDIDKPNSTNSDAKLQLQSLLDENKQLQDIISQNSTNNKIKSDALAKQKTNDETTLNILFSEYCNSYKFIIKASNSPHNSNEEKDAQKELTKEEFERVLKEEYDPKKNEFKNNFNLNLILNLILIQYTESIKQLQSNKKDSTSNKFDSPLSKPSNALSNSELKKVNSIKPLPHNQAQDIYDKMGESFRDFSSSIMSGLQFNKQPDSPIKSTPKTPLSNQAQSFFSDTLDSVVKSFSKTGNGLFENTNGNPIHLASESRPFQIPQQWLTGSESLQSWLSCTTTSLFTSIPKSVKQEPNKQEPNKQEPDSGDDHNLQQRIRESVMASLAKRHTPPLQTKPTSPEKATSQAITASERASEASMRARLLASSAPAKRPPRPQSGFQTTTGSERSAISSRANSVVGVPAKSSLTGLTSHINISQSVSGLKRKRGEEDQAPAGIPRQPLSATESRIAYFKVGANSPAAQHEKKEKKR